MSKTTVIHHGADFDGLFCREIARKFLPNAELIGWDFADRPLPIPDGQIYIMDLPVDRVFGFAFAHKNEPEAMPCGWEWLDRVVWLDHHKSSIESHPDSIPGYRIDGVAACRIAWQWFNPTFGDMKAVIKGVAVQNFTLPSKQDFIDRKVSEPLAVRLAGEYDIWDKRDPRAEVFQFGLRSQEISENMWELLLVNEQTTATQHDVGTEAVNALLENGALLQRYQQSTDAGIVNYRSFLVEFEGLKFLALNTARCNSLTFAAKDVPETGHDALMGFYFNGSKWTVSLYHANHRKDIDLSQIAVKHGGGGHKGACGFTCVRPPFVSLS